MGKFSIGQDKNEVMTANRAYSGGIRGIVELEVLSRIEQVLGGKISITKFVDLIVGTRCVSQNAMMPIHIHKKY